MQARGGGVPSPRPPKNYQEVAHDHERDLLERHTRRGHPGAAAGDRVLCLATTEDDVDMTISRRSRPEAGNMSQPGAARRRSREAEGPWEGTTP